MKAAVSLSFTLGALAVGLASGVPALREDPTFTVVRVALPILFALAALTLVGLSIYRRRQSTSVGGQARDR